MFLAIRSVYIWITNTLLVLVWWPIMRVVLLTEKDPRRIKTARWLRRLGRIFTRVNPWRIHVSGMENFDATQTYVVVANHQSLADIPILCHLRIDAKWMAKVELFRLPVAGSLLSMGGDVPVDRSDMRKAAKALLECGRILRENVSMVFFPEGTRSLDGEVLPFNDGPFQLAIREQKLILPVVIEGSSNALPKQSWIFTNAENVQLRVLPAVSPEGYTTKQSAELREKVRQIMVDELARLRRR